MKVKTEDIRNAFKVVDSVPLSPVIESSQFVRIRASGSALTVNLTGVLLAEASVDAIGEGGKWTAYADRRVFKTFLNTAKDTELELFMKDKLTLKCKQRLELALHSPISGYESWTPKKLFELTDDQAAMLKTAVKYIPTVTGTEYIEAIHFGAVGEIMLVTNSVTIMAMDKTKVGAPFLLPAIAAGVLASSGGKISVDDKGVGIVMDHGYVYQPLSSELDKYPAKKLEKTIDQAEKSPTLTIFEAKTLLDTISVADQFLADRLDSAKVSAGKNGELVITVDFGSGKFQRTVAPAGKTTFSKEGLWPVKRLLPWLDYIVSVKNDCQIEYARIDDISAAAFRYADGPRKNTFIFVDV